MNNKKAKSPEQIPELFVAYWNKRNAAGIASLFKEDAEFINVVGLWWHDRKAIEKAHKYGLEVIFNDSSLRLTRVKKRILADNIVAIHAKMKLEGQTPKGDITRTQERHNIFTFVCSKTDEEWYCVCAHNTDIVPGMETNIMDASGNFRAIDYRK